MTPSSCPSRIIRPKRHFGIDGHVVPQLNPALYTHAMSLLEPRWEQLKPTAEEAEEMCNQVSITVVRNPSDAIDKVLGLLRTSHTNGGALFAAFRVGESEVFDWFASRNRLAEYSILGALLRRDEVQKERKRQTNACRIICGCFAAQAAGVRSAIR